ncbi:MAG: hypothetical protein ACTS6G_02960 [Candidatus Hodgkinia cicadicola]
MRIQRNNETCSSRRIVALTTLSKRSQRAGKQVSILRLVIINPEVQVPAKNKRNLNYLLDGTSEVVSTTFSSLRSLKTLPPLSPNVRRGKRRR